MTNVQKQAAIYTAKLFGIAALVGLLTPIVINVLLTYVTFATLGTAFMLALLVYFVKMVYDIKVSQLSSLEKLNKE